MVKFACCESSIGPRCGHAIGGAGVTLERLARESLEVAPDPSSGLRPSDPLAEVVNADTWREHIDAAELVAGRDIERAQGDELMAARVRSVLRRHVARGVR